MIQKKIFNSLKSLVDGRCFYGVIPETNKQFPVIVYDFPNVKPNLALEEGDLDDFLVQIDIYSNNPDDIFNLRKLVFSAISKEFEYAERINDFTDYEDDTKLYRRVINYTIAYKE
ncbi:Protein of uncharacterised function (DUF3168) [Phocoenobacter uteri]|uniref:Protein of uncharacterized function (DUF3168) n=1 Tax=Phocoenobacter uteri TaxID=146806 RepID=A0A379C9M4_9PAST|nr:DUF3168 domain-containing protein [Phocoenobacter uteri]MDG6880949.1 hypothetical protein [Phocoenobacter uteri]MDG6882794.1 hypothetical protein [Phocoenobacter uteri]SUB58964.1 Protein of uncharacterised function (DUF3168) [Phocoenobacter uteri]